MAPNLDRHIVTAVLVAHDGADWLPETLKALLTQSQPIQRLVAVDTGSRDRGPAVLAEIVGEGNLLQLPRTTGYGAAVAEALEHPAASIAVPAAENAYTSAGGQVEWVWLVHDDSAPTTETLRILLAAAEQNPSAAVLGPKLRDWYDRRKLAEAGITIDGAGRRDTGLDRSEFDQGQHDGLREVFAVSTAGMLVRRDVWEELGGIDPDLGLFRDDIDLCWRACAAGHKVMLVTDAVMHHAEASVRGRRTGMTKGDHGHRPRRLDRRNALFVLLAHVPFPAAFGTLARLVFGSLLRAVAFLVIKRPAYATDELVALRDVLSSPRFLYRGRRARAANRKRGYYAFKRFQLGRQTVRRVGDLASTFLSRSEAFAPAGGGYDAPATDDDLPAEQGVFRQLLARPGVLMLLALIAVTIAAERSVLFAGSGLGGGALVPAWGGASDLWADYLAGWHPVGLGSEAGSPPYIGLLALLSTITLGKPWLAVTALLLGGIPLAGVSAFIAARPVVPSPVVRAWLGATYALLPVATGAVSGGRLGTIVVLVLLPPIGLLISKILLGPAAEARGAAWGAGLLLAVAMAFVPLVWLLVLVAGGLVWLAFGERVRGLGATTTIILVVPPLLQLPSTLWLLLHPSGFLLEAGLNRPGMTAEQLSAESLLALNPGGPGTPEVWATAGALLIGLTALAVRRGRLVILAGWMLALYGFLAAILVAAVPVPQGAGTAAAWPGVALAVAALGVGLAAAGGGRWARDVFAQGGLLRRSGIAVAALVALTTPVVAAASWVVAGTSGPLTKVDSALVPPFISASSGNNRQPRTLVLRQNPADGGGVSYTVLRGRAPRIGEAETPVDHAARARLDAQVAALVAGGAGDEGKTLARFGIQYILVPGSAGTLARTLDGLPGLSRLSRTDEYSTWRVTQPSGRLMLIEGNKVTPLPAGQVDTRLTIPPGSGTRLLLLAEPADGGWRASLNGEDVPSRSVDGWAQGYDIPASGGDFVLTRGMWLRHLWLVFQAMALVAVIVLGLPGARLERVEEPWAWGRARGRRAGRAVGKVLRRRATDETADETADGTTGETTDETTGSAAADRATGSLFGGASAGSPGSAFESPATSTFGGASGASGAFGGPAGSAFDDAGGLGEADEVTPPPPSLISPESSVTVTFSSSSSRTDSPPPASEESASAWTRDWFGTGSRASSHRPEEPAADPGDPADPAAGGRSRSGGRSRGRRGAVGRRRKPSRSRLARWRRSASEKAGKGTEKDQDSSAEKGAAPGPGTGDDAAARSVDPVTATPEDTGGVPYGTTDTWGTTDTTDTWGITPAPPPYGDPPARRPRHPYDDGISSGGPT